MNENTIPDPVAELFGNSQTSRHRVLKELSERLKKVRFCQAGGGTDHDDCIPFERLDEALLIVKELNCSLREVMPGSKDLRFNVADWCLGKLCDCCKRDRQPDGFDRELKTVEDCKQFLIERAKALDVSWAGPDARKAEMPEMHWDEKARSYCVQTDDLAWHHENTEQAYERCRAAGIDTVPPDRGHASDAEQFLLEVRNRSSVAQMIELAGYSRGIHTIKGKDYLVPRGFSLIEPKDHKTGSFDHVMAIIEGLFTKKSKAPIPGMATPGEVLPDPLPAMHVLLWMREAYEALRDGRRGGGPALFLAGARDVGKSLFIETILAPFLGDRLASAQNYIIGASTFNDELVWSEIWLIDDAPPPGDAVARRRYAGMVKQSVAAGNIAGHGKGLAQMTFPAFRRLIVALNPEDVESLPYLSADMEDKYLLIACHPFEMPEGCFPLPKPSDRPAFAAKIREELPFFLDWLLGLDLSAYADRRFGVQAYKDPDLVAENADVSGLDSKYLIIYNMLFSGENSDALEDLSTAEVYHRLVSHHNAQQLFGVARNPIALGMLLSSLAASKSHFERVKVRILDGYKCWTFFRQPVDIIDSVDSVDSVGHGKFTSGPRKRRIHCEDSPENID